jgi:hypothetical protein
MNNPLSNHTDLIGKMKQEAGRREANWDTTVQQTERKTRRKNALLKLVFGLGATFTGGYWIYYEVIQSRPVKPGTLMPLFLLIIGGFAILIGGVQLYRAIDRGEVGWGFGLLWGLLSSIGNVVGLILAFLVLGIFAMASGDTPPQAADSLPTLGLIPSALIVSLIPAAAGLALGAAQWLMLRKQISGAGWWVAVTALGFALPIIMGIVLDTSPVNLGLSDMSDVAFGAVVGFSLGITVGVAQWLMLRRQMAQAGWWVPASTLGFCGMAAGIGFESSHPGASFLGLIAYGGITGLVMVWLLRRSFSGR